MSTRAVIAMDVGGTKVSAAVVTADGSIVTRERAPTRRGNAEALINQLVDIAQRLRSASARKPVAIGVALPAVVDVANGIVIWAPNLNGWRDIPLSALLRDETALPAVLSFDGHAAVVGEHWHGAARGTVNAALLSIGTGIGGGFVLDGQLYHGTSNLAGAAGWMITDPRHAEGAESHVRGSLEEIAAGPGLVAAAERALKDGAVSCLTAPVTTRDILSAADRGDLLASKVMERASDAVAYAAVGIISLVNPEVLLIGGGLGLATPIYVDKARQIVANLAQPVSGRAVRIVRAELGEDGPLLGSARFALHGLATT